jgi:hypothetical protein
MNEASDEEVQALRARLRREGAARYLGMFEHEGVAPLLFEDPLLDRLREVHVEPRYDFFQARRPR